MKAFFPCAGFGTRMGEWTESLPKPLLKINNIPLIYYSLFHAKSWGVDDAILNIHYLGEKVKEELIGFKNFQLHFSTEFPEILGTGGGIRTGIEKFWNLQDDFLVLNPDFILFPEPGFNPWPNPEEQKTFDCILYLSKIPENSNYTGLSLKDDMIRFEAGGYFYLGLCWMKAECLSDLEPNRPYDLADTFRQLSAENRLGGKIFPGTFLDLGEKQFYEKYKDTDFSDRLSSDWKKFRKRISS
ncbi:MULTISPECIES: NTP transferase domain-containing protein [unclassified Leptospira]|uniref:NTP transferase domain-containing protein n=1 Tax=unclassified Leptospira TaxID=2633828 RepID=UPI0002BF491A|nr:MULTISPECIES: NTP transferase domain-containing protein [unclassified Leptospira]EMJ98961.1 MobA-like NTP transferase domain protein [Leptospira sp. B5-022]MCR1794091.1 NTP transferase domain-containing protein [Leptospira sp. id769339]